MIGGCSYEVIYVVRVAVTRSLLVLFASVHERVKESVFLHVRDVAQSTRMVTFIEVIATDVVELI